MSAVARITIYQDEAMTEVVVFQGWPRRPVYVCYAHVSPDQTFAHHRPATPFEIDEADRVLLAFVAEKPAPICCHGTGVATDGALTWPCGCGINEGQVA